ncbi:MAG: PhzF family phenazine biosynthesis protein [Thermaerobacter sp.]|nr:PhzF family phenazine biosynthesis protein [Thermaerobacter sp.]
MTQLMQVDVFSAARLGGNPLAVFVDPPTLSDDRYQAWAREMNLSESIFVWPESSERYRARIFTPTCELGFAGHPTLGAAWALHHLGHLEGASATQVTEAGASPVSYESDGTVWFQPPARELANLVDPPAVGAALGIPTLWMELALPPQAAWVGVGHLAVQLQSDHVATVKPNLERITRLLEAHHLAGVLVWSFTAAARIHARVFVPAAGVEEDPATGSAAAVLGVILTQAAGVTEPTRYVISQGVEMGRPSEVLLTVNHTGPGSVAVGGRVAPVFVTEVEMGE